MGLKQLALILNVEAVGNEESWTSPKLTLSYELKQAAPILNVKGDEESGTSALQEQRLEFLIVSVEEVGGIARCNGLKCLRRNDDEESETSTILTYRLEIK